MRLEFFEATRHFATYFLFCSMTSKDDLPTEPVEPRTIIFCIIKKYLKRQKQEYKKGDYQLYQESHHDQAINY